MRIHTIALAAMMLFGCNPYGDYMKNQAKITEQEAEARRLAEEKKHLDAQLKDQSAKIDGLLSQLSSAKDEATRLALQKQLEEARAKQRGVRPGGGAAKPCNCQPDDPLCSCL